MIVIPMAGRSQRFRDAGYEAAKFMLPLGVSNVFAHAVSSFERYFEDTPFLFITMGDEAADFVTGESARLGIAQARVAALAASTAGQAETVALGLDKAGAGDDVALTIFNIDTFRPGFQAPGAELAALDGWLEVFQGEGANWSYVKPSPGEPGLVLETAEKRQISDLCCTGLYHFARAGDFRQALAAERQRPQARELYIAPLYNHLIGWGARIGYRTISRQDVVFCGTPDEYEVLRRPAEPY